MSTVEDTSEVEIPENMSLPCEEREIKLRPPEEDMINLNPSEDEDDEEDGDDEEVENDEDDEDGQDEEVEYGEDEEVEEVDDEEDDEEDEELLTSMEDEFNLTPSKEIGSVKTGPAEVVEIISIPLGDEGDCHQKDPKRRKYEVALDKSVKSIHNTQLRDFGTFLFKRVVTENSQKKTVVVEGIFENVDGVALVLFEKEPFSKKSLKEGYLTNHSRLFQEFHNDLYGNYSCHSNSGYNSIKTTIIHPATEEHIKKFEPKTLHIIQETSELYKSVTLPYLETKQIDFQWVWNILEHKKDAERIVFENPDPETGFVLVPNLKWSSKEVEDLYMVAIVHKRGIRSIRDLTTEHLPLLKNIFNEGIAAIEAKYQLPASQLRIFLHYQPSYYHLHVHFTNLKLDVSGICAEKSHLLSSVIANIELMSDYYQRATINFVAREGNGLFQSYEQAGQVRKAKVKMSPIQVEAEVIEID